MMTNNRPFSADERAASAARAQTMIAWVREFASRRINSLEIDERRCIPPHVVLSLGEQGFLAMQIPASEGGSALTNRDVVRVLEQLGGIDLTLASFALTNNFPGIRPILVFGSESLKRSLVPRLARGRMLAGYAQTEPGSGSDFQAMAARGVPAAGGWRLSGDKIWVGNAGWAGVINVLVNLEDERGEPLGLTAFAVDPASQGFSIGAEHWTMGLRGMVQNRLTLDAVPVTREAMLGEPGGGLAVAYDSMSATRLGIAALCLGGMKRCAQLFLRFAERRNIATGRLVNNPLALATLSEMSAQIDAMEALLDCICTRLDDGDSVPGEVLAVAKVAGSEFASQAADRLVQGLGGRGYDEINLAAQLARDARVTRIFEGTTEVLLSFVGARVWVESPDFFHFLAETLGAPAVAAELRQAVGRLRERTWAAGTPLSEVTMGTPWRFHLIGNLAFWALLAAVLEQRAARQPGLPPTVLAWVRQRVAEARTQALSGSPAEASLDRRDAVVARLNTAFASIGDIEQSLPGLGRELDDLLARNRAQ